MSILSPFTTRSPRLTLASDGKPRLRLLVVSKPELFEVLLFRVHGTFTANEPFIAMSSINDSRVRPLMAHCRTAAQRQRPFATGQTGTKHSQLER